METLDFSTSNPKVMTYHSAKGLQFRDVFIPFCENSIVNKSMLDRKTREPFYPGPLYVAVTRAVDRLTITYSETLTDFFDNIPQNLYRTEIEEDETPDF